jgi:hypothetical protein
LQHRVGPGPHYIALHEGYMYVLLGLFAVTPFYFYVELPT